MRWHIESNFNFINAKGEEQHETRVYEGWIDGIDTEMEARMWHENRIMERYHVVGPIETEAKKED